MLKYAANKSQTPEPCGAEFTPNATHIAMQSLLQSSLTGLTPRRGKVRDIYDFGDRLLFVATDRISAFDHVLPTGIASCVAREGQTFASE